MINQNKTNRGTPWSQSLSKGAKKDLPIELELVRKGYNKWGLAGLYKIYLPCFYQVWLLWHTRFLHEPAQYITSSRLALLAWVTEPKVSTYFEKLSCEERAEALKRDSARNSVHVRSTLSTPNTRLQLEKMCHTLYWIQPHSVWLNIQTSNLRCELRIFHHGKLMKD